MHVPLIKDTYHLIDEERLAVTKFFQRLSISMTLSWQSLLFDPGHNLFVYKKE
ncbi:hypothetical protein [Bacillus salipaludis]|uniref:hypothetical protein n=1 Tax=Bacillus salipaludis TaxID=2547811 RepID=UPI002E1BB2AA|nr:hypothetical protein [Bacillus salipaludis]